MGSKTDKTASTEMQFFISGKSVTFKCENNQTMQYMQDDSGTVIMCREEDSSDFWVYILAITAILALLAINLNMDFK